MSLRSFSHAYGESNYHIVLVPKYRRDIFKNIHVARCCRLIFQEIANQYGYKILSLEIMENHVHLFLEVHPTHSLSGHSSYSKVSQLENSSGDSQV